MKVLDTKSIKPNSQEITYNAGRSQSFFYSYNFWRASCLSLVFLLFTILWFSPFSFHTFMGDDLRLLLGARQGGYASSLVSAWFQEEFNKYRPVTTFVLALQIKFFGDNFRSYINFNLALEFVNVALMAFLAWRISGQRWLAAICAGVMFLVSRFAYYFTLQIWGTMEALGLLFLLLMVYSVWWAYQKQKAWSFIWLIVCYTVIIYTHERYLALAPFVVLAIVLAPKSFNFKGWYQRLLWAALPIIMAGLNYGLKTYIFKMRFLEGTGGNEIKFDLGQFLGFMWSGCLNLLGFNAGPNYLSGLDVAQAGLAGIILGLTLTLSISGLVLLWMLSKLKFDWEQKEHWWLEGRNLILYLALLVPLLAGASITIRQEYRWLYSPYAIFILGIIYLFRGIRLLNWLRNALLILVLLSAMSVDIFYRDYISSNVFFMQAMSLSDSAKSEVVDHYESNLSQKDIYIVTYGDKSSKSWIFFDNNFFQLYAHDSHVRVNYIDNLESLPLVADRLDKMLVFSQQSDKIIDITNSVRPALARRLQTPTKVSFDFIAAYNQGEINEYTPVSTPNGQGVFPMLWASDLGPVKTISIVTGYKYSYQNIEVKDGDTLNFDLAMPLAVGDGAQAFVDITTTDGKVKRIFTSDLVPSHTRSPDWLSYVVPLKEYGGKKINITFGVDSPSGDPSGDWVAFSQLQLLSVLH